MPARIQWFRSHHPRCILNFHPPVILLFFLQIKSESQWDELVSSVPDGKVLFGRMYMNG